MMERACCSYSAKSMPQSFQPNVSTFTFIAMMTPVKMKLKKTKEGRKEGVRFSGLCKQLNQHTGTGNNSHDSVGKVHQHLPHQVNRVLRAWRQRRVVGCGGRGGRGVVSQACNCVCMCGVPCLLTEATSFTRRPGERAFLNLPLAGYVTKAELGQGTVRDAMVPLSEQQRQQQHVGCTPRGSRAERGTSSPTAA